MRGIGEWAKLSRRPFPVGRTAQQAGVHAVLNVAGENTVLDEDGALGGRALVVNGQRAAAVREGPVVDDGDAGRWRCAGP